jgi:hypothetical protein
VTEDHRNRSPILALVLLAATALAAATVDGPPPVPAPDEEGYVLTTVRGTEVLRVPLRFVGLLDDGLGPGIDIWLVELQGPVAEEVGVASGMSGSPVYFGDRLVGSLSYRFGLMPKRAIGGVTPVDSMRAASVAVGAGRPGETGGLAPITTPVMVGGAVAPVRDWLSNQLEGTGLAAVAAGGGPGETVAQELRPGSPVAIELVRGDMRLAATGTVTWIDGETVYAFGHPFLAGGRVAMPMSTAEVVHTLSDMAGSTKITNIGAEVGAILDDRLTAVVGRLGAEAPMFPLTVEVTGGSFGAQRLDYEIAGHRTLTPLLVGAATANALMSNVGYEREATIRASGTIVLEDLPDLPAEFAFATGLDGDPTATLAGAMQRLLGRLYANPFREPRVERIELKLHADASGRSYRVDRLLYDRGPVKPGQEIRLTCVLRTYRDESVRRTLTMRVPERTAPGTRISVAVGSPRALQTALGAPIETRLASATDLETWIEVLATRQASDRLAGALYRGDTGVIAEGELLNELPPTATRLLSSGVPKSRRPASRVTVMDRTDTRLDGPVTGGMVARFQVEGGDR